MATLAHVLFVFIASAGVATLATEACESCTGHESNPLNVLLGFWLSIIGAAGVLYIIGASLLTVSVAAVITIVAVTWAMCVRLPKDPKAAARG